MPSTHPRRAGPVPGPDTRGARPRHGSGGYLLVPATVLVLAGHLWGLYRVPGPAETPWFAGADKLLHLVGFAVPVLLVSLCADRFDGSVGLDGAVRLTHRARVLAVAAVFAGHAVVSEVIQARLIPGRTGDATDVAADLAGIAVGTAAYATMARSRR